MYESDGGSKVERRRLTAAWLNIVAAGLVSAGALPLLTAVALEGWGSRAAALGALALLALALGALVHLIGRLLIPGKRPNGLDSSVRMFVICSHPRRAKMDQDPPANEDSFPTERDVQDVLDEFGGDARAAIRALLHDLNALASDYESTVSKGFIRARWRQQSA